jgi:hypothetical protein
MEGEPMAIFHHRSVKNEVQKMKIFSSFFSCHNLWCEEMRGVVRRKREKGKLSGGDERESNLSHTSLSDVIVK